MKRRILAVTLTLLCVAVNAFGADGDLIVNGKLGVGTSSPGYLLTVSSPA